MNQQPKVVEATPDEDTKTTLRAVEDEPVAPPAPTLGGVKFLFWADEEATIPVYDAPLHSGELLITALNHCGFRIMFDTNCKEVFFDRLDDDAMGDSDEPVWRDRWKTLDDQTAALIRLIISQNCCILWPTVEQPFRYKPLHFYPLHHWFEAMRAASALTKGSILKNYFLSLPELPEDYDGPTLYNWLDKSFGCEDTELTRFIQWAGLVGIALRTLWPGCLIRAYPVLVGDQDIGKSSIVASILPEHLSAFHTDEVDLSMPDADLIYPIKGKGPIELSEMRGATKGQAQKIKHFTTRTMWKDRLKYGHDAITIVFSHMFIGTANSSNSFLPGDLIAAMRFLPIELHGGCNAEAFMAKWREPLLRQAVDAAQALVQEVKDNPSLRRPKIRVPRDLRTEHKEVVEEYRAIAFDVYDVVDDKLPTILRERFRNGIQHVNILQVLKDHEYTSIGSHQLKDALEESPLWVKKKVQGTRLWRGTPEAIAKFEPIWAATPLPDTPPPTNPF